MKRIPESELMDDDEQAQAYASADFEEPHSKFISLFKEIFPDKSITGDVLDLGCGPGDITFRFARAFPKCIIHGIDGSEAMLRCGYDILKPEDEVKERVQLIYGLLPDVILPISRYDVIISNSLLHHLNDPMVLWNTVRQYAKAGTLVYIMDLKRPPEEENARRLVNMYTSNEPELLQRDFYNSLLAAFEPDEIRSQLNNAGLNNLVVKDVSDRHVLIYGSIVDSS